MTHLFKIPLPHADLFINKIDMEEQIISWQVYDKEGNPMEPLKTEKYICISGNIFFDKSRSFPIPFITRVAGILAPSERSDEFATTLES